MTADLDREGRAAPPRSNGELVFEAPWERQLFGVTMALHDRGVFAWGDFNAHLIDEIARWTADADASDEYVYYQHWARALSRLLDERGVIDPAAVDARAREIAALPAGHDHDHHATTGRGAERHMTAAEVSQKAAASQGPQSQATRFVTEPTTQTRNPQGGPRCRI